MKTVFLLFFLPAVALAQSPDVTKQGEEIFNKTCASGYCHGGGGAGGGAPRIAARGFDQTFISNTVTRGIPNTLSRAERNAVVVYVGKLNGIANTATGSGGVSTAAPAGAALSGEAAR